MLKDNSRQDNIDKAKQNMAFIISKVFENPAHARTKSLVFASNIPVILFLRITVINNSLKYTVILQH